MRSILSFSVLLLAFLILACTPLAAGQHVTPPDSAAQAASAISPLVEGLLGKFGWITQVVLVIGSLRILFKPLMAAVHNYADNTPSPTDNEVLDKFEHSAVFRAIAFILDWGASIKLIKK